MFLRNLKIERFRHGQAYQIQMLKQNHINLGHSLKIPTRGLVQAGTEQLLKSKLLNFSDFKKLSKIMQLSDQT